MLNSRELSLLRDDVERNARCWIRRCAAEGLAVLITQTVRDNEYQAYLYAQGRTRAGKIITNSKTTTFHGAGLAVDFCKNVKGEEYSDTAFFDRAIELAKEFGFSSGADWESFPEKCHLQWDEKGKYQFNRGKGPGQMPFCEEDEMITEKSVEQMSDSAVLALTNRVQTLLGRQVQSGKVGEELEDAVRMEITDGAAPKQFVTRAQAAVMAKRAAEWAVQCMEKEG